MNTVANINEFFNMPSIAIAGVSTNKKKFGYTVFKELKNKGLNVLPVNPFAETIDGEKCYPNVKSLPSDTKAVVVLTAKNKTGHVVKDAIEAGISHLWIQQWSETPEAIRFASEHGIKLITKKCVLMFAGEAHGVHKFHKVLLKIFGMLPK